MAIDEEIVRFREENMSHNSANEFLSNMGKDVREYKQIFLSVTYINKSEDGIHKTELKLAKTAMKRKCEYVSNIDYCEPVIAATGLIPIN